MAYDPANLLDAARAARANAYAPYSHFSVGAALLARDGRVFTGANVENASYGLSMCAERVAVYAAVATGALAFEAIAVVGPDHTATTPCGACRQVLIEFGPKLTVITQADGLANMQSIAELLPAAFSPQTLEDAR